MAAVIECRNVTYTYPLGTKPAIRDLSLDIESGVLYGVAGENGAGKTTLGALLMGFAPRFYKGELKGEVTVKGRPVSEYGGEIARIAGYVFQNPFTQISGVKDTVFEEVAFGLENFGAPALEIERRVTDVMRLTGIEELAMLNPLNLSGGQMQRVALASVTVLDPEIFILDEPTSQLDPEGTESVFKIIRGLKEASKTIILIEHKIDLLAEYADEMLILKGGGLVARGRADTVLSDPELLLKQGVKPPQAALLGKKLIDMGLPLSGVPVTERQAVEEIKKALKKGKETRPEVNPSERGFP